MTFISYAQNFEDVMLWRALKNVECGFYIDVGAWSPDTDSVTRAFYERGWCGINIEPNTEFLNQLVERRSRDTNLGCAIGDQSGCAEIIILDNPGLSTLDETIAKAHLDAGYSAMRRGVEVMTLQHVCENYLPAAQSIHFLKVDVEGLEPQVIRGNDWRSFRPWIVLVEATVPMSQTESCENWESILEDASYRFCYADGLNRFYVAEEHADLASAFDYPPNVFDEFMTYAHSSAEAKALESEEYRKRADRLKEKADKLKERADRLEEELQALYSSASWRVTRPLRKMKGIVKWLLHLG